MAKSSQPRTSTLALALLAFACSSRTRSACVGHSPKVVPAEMSSVSLFISHQKATPQMNWPDAPEYDYRGLSVSLDLPAEDDEPCLSVPEPTRVELNGIDVPVLERGGGTNTFISRSDRTTTCHSLRSEMVTSSLLGGPMKSGGDVVTITADGKALTVNFAAGRPTVSVDATKHEIVVDLDGLDGEVRDGRTTPYFALWTPTANEGVEVKQQARDKTRLRLAYDPKTLGASRTWTLLGDITVVPRATCIPARTDCKVFIGYALRAKVELPAPPV